MGGCIRRMVGESIKALFESKGYLLTLNPLDTKAQDGDAEVQPIATTSSSARRNQKLEECGELG